METDPDLLECLDVLRPIALTQTESDEHGRHGAHKSGCRSTVALLGKREQPFEIVVFRRCSALRGILPGRAVDLDTNATRSVDWMLLAEATLTRPPDRRSMPGGL
jgi:hypothetical protein